MPQKDHEPLVADVDVSTCSPLAKCTPANTLSVSSRRNPACPALEYSRIIDVSEGFTQTHDFKAQKPKSRVHRENPSPSLRFVFGLAFSDTKPKSDADGIQFLPKAAIICAREIEMLSQRHAQRTLATVVLDYAFAS